MLQISPICNSPCANKTFSILPTTHIKKPVVRPHEYKAHVHPAVLCVLFSDNCRRTREFSIFLVRSLKFCLVGNSGSSINRSAGHHAVTSYILALVLDIRCLIPTMAQLNLTETSNSLKTWLGHGTPMRCGLHLSTTSSGGFSGTMENDEFVSVMQTFTANPQKQVSQSRSSSDHNSSTLTLDMLPSEILFQIFRHLSASAILRIGRCNRRLAAVSSSDRLVCCLMRARACADACCSGS